MSMVFVRTERHRRVQDELCDELQAAPVADPEHPITPLRPVNVGAQPAGSSASVNDHSDSLVRHNFPSPSSSDGSGCPADCCCLCHDVQWIPRALSPFLGTFSFLRAGSSCTDSTCGHRKRTIAMEIKWRIPALSVQVDACIQSQALYFRIQTPRIVESLACLRDSGLDDVRRMLSSREITLYDVEPDGEPVVHVRVCRIYAAKHTLIRNREVYDETAR